MIDPVVIEFVRVLLKPGYWRHPVRTEAISLCADPLRLALAPERGHNQKA